MKRTPVLIDVNGVPLRESLSYNGGGAGFGGQMAEWLPPSQSADAALLPALRLGNARADDLVRNNGIAANAVALHKDCLLYTSGDKLPDLLDDYIRATTE